MVFLSKVWLDSCMDSGRVVPEHNGVNIMATIKKAVVTINGRSLSFETATNVFELHADDLDSALQTRALMHGLKQKIADTYAGLKTDHEIDEAIRGCMNALLAGTWNAGRSSLGGIWVEALAKAAGVSIDEAAETWNGLGDDAKKDLKKNPAVKQAKAQIELDRAKAEAEGSSLDLSDL